MNGFTESSGERPLLLVVDLFNLVFRAYFALPRLTSSTGEPTGAVMGVLRMIRKLLREHQPQAVAVAMDSEAPVERKKIFEDYKATRPPAPSDLKDQIPVIREALSMLGLESFTVDGWEADDVIATLARRAREDGWMVLVASGDKDLAQLVDDRLHLVVEEPGSGSGRVLDAAAVESKWGVPPPRILDLLSLMGDSSDNIPGVPKVGPKTAAKLIGEHGNLDSILAAAPGMRKSKLRDNLLTHAQQALLSRKLVRLEDELAIDPDWEELAPGDPADPSGLARLLDRLELRDLALEILGEEGRSEIRPGDEKDYGAILDLEELEAEIRRVREAGAVSVDLETTGLDPTRVSIVGVSLSCEAGRGRYVPTGHVHMGAPPQLALERVLEMLRPLLEDPELAIYGQHVKYEDVLFTRRGIRMRGVAFDTMLASYLLDPDRHQHRLDQIAMERLGHRMISYDEVTRKQRGSQLGFEEVPVDEAARYSSEDAEIVWSLVPDMREDLERAGLEALLQELELPLSRVLADMELTGVSLDTSYLGRIERTFEKELMELEERAHDAGGREFNIASPKQLQAVLFDEIGLEPIRKTKTGWSTDSEVLEELRSRHDLPGIVLEWRGLSKLLGTYIRSLPQAVNPATGRVHTSYNQAVASTGRLSSSGPNLQNIPIRSERGRLIRSAFRPSQGCRLLSADYSQIELRVLAHLSADQDLVDAFRSGQDVHARTASQVFGMDPGDVSSELRSRAKAINFGVIYGQTDFGLSQQLGIPRKQAKEFIDRYFERYTGVRDYMRRVVSEAREGRGVRTLLGRRRFLRGIDSRNHVERSNAERMARNTPIQGTAADIIKLAMIRLHEQIRVRGLSSRMVLTVHDELVLDVPEEESEATLELVVEVMESAMVLHVPLLVDTSWGEDWGQAHP